MHTWLKAILLLRFYPFITLSIPKYTKKNIMICIINSPCVTAGTTAATVGATVTTLVVAAAVGAIVATAAGATGAKRKKQTFCRKIA